MCRLLGVIANKPVDLRFSLERFKGLARRNPDGWGIGWYEDNHPKLFKRGISATSPNSQYGTQSRRVASKIIIAHVRKRTGGEPSKRNAHPFRSGKWLFAHNGGVNGDRLFRLLNPKLRKEIKGETGSERFFHYIKQNIEEQDSVVEGITQAVRGARRSRYTGLNLLLSDGQSMFALRYAKYAKSKGYYSLYHLKRNPSDSDSLEFKSRKTGALLQSKLLRGESAVLVCSEKLTNDEDWKAVGWGNMLRIGPGLETEEIPIIRG